MHKNYPNTNKLDLVEDVRGTDRFGEDAVCRNAVTHI